MKKQLTTLIFLSLYLFLSAAFAQTENVEIREPDIAPLLKLTDQIKTSDSAVFKSNLNQLTQFANGASVEQQEFIEYLNAYEYILDGDFDGGQKRLNELFNAATSKFVKIRIKATLANVQAISREYNKALDNLDYAIEQADLSGDKELIEKIYLISSVVYYQLDVFEMSMKYAVLLLSANPSEVKKCKASVNLYRSKLSLKQEINVSDLNDTIELCYRVSEFIYAALLELDWINIQLEDVAKLTDEGFIKTLLGRLQLIESNIDEFGYNNLIGFKDMVMAKAYHHINESELALDKALKAIEGSTLSGNTIQVVDSMRILQQDALNKGQFKEAYEFSHRISLIEREIFNEAKSKQMAYMTVKHNNLARQIEIQQLKQNNQLLTLENQLSDEAKKRQQLVMLLVFVVLLLLALWTFKIKKKHDYFKNVAEIDHLTQVFTRKAFEERLGVMLAEGEAKNTAINLGIMDLDHFKSVNDRFGHLVGDWVLKHVILVCEELANQDILMARLGGEEFCIVSPGITQIEMYHLMERMREGIEKMDCSGSGSAFSITASFGISSALESGYKLSMLLTHADLALFEAKKRGRNQVLVFNQLDESSKVS